MRCANCMKENKDGVKFCIYCGHPLGEGGEEKSIQEEQVQKPRIKTGVDIKKVNSFDYTLTIILFGYIAAGGIIGFFSGGILMLGNDGAVLGVMIGAVLGGVLGYMNVIVGKVLISIARNIHIAVYNQSVIDNDIRELLEKEKTGGDQKS